MGLFSKKASKAAPEETAALPEQPQRSLQTAALTSGRMANLYQRLYQWIFSVNITADVYQIESGTSGFFDETIAFRGYYNELLSQLEQVIAEPQRPAFRAAFAADSILDTARDGRTCVVGQFFAMDFSAETKDENEFRWYEFRAEWAEEINLKNLVLIFSVRRISGDLDSGRAAKPREVPRLSSQGKVDWDKVRATRIRRAKGSMEFAYHLTEDTLYLRRISGDSESERITPNFLRAISSRADYILSHDAVQVVKSLIDEATTEEKQSVILCRKNGTQGAPFCHYRLSGSRLAGSEGEWIVGSLEDIEEETVARERSLGIATAVDTLLQISNISLYYINTERSVIYRILQDETGFHREEKGTPLTEYLQKRIAGGRIAPEFKGEYLKWLEKGYLFRKTTQGIYEFESKMKDMQDVDFQWYIETILPVNGKPGHFFRWRRNDTTAHQTREIRFENEQLARIGEYNRQMLDVLAGLIEFRSLETSTHIVHVRTLTKILLEDVQLRSPQYALTNQQINMYVQAATMHDIGKISAPDYILNKEGRYTPEEFTIMKKHTTDGAAVVDRFEMPGWEDLKACIRDVVLHHHERYDGSGYPDRLVGDETAIGVQAVSLADVFDALVSVRCYKESYTTQEAVRMILNGECGSFNPCLLESLKACESRMSAIYTE